MVQQLKLEDWDQSLAYKMADFAPEDEEVFFKTKDGETYQGEHWKGLGFEANGITFEDEEVIEWHPVTVDM